LLLLSRDDMEVRHRILCNINTKSIWTSDLMWQLHQWNVQDHQLFRHALVSKNIASPDKDYQRFDYYQHSFADDQERVSKTFQVLCRLEAPMMETKKLSFFTVLGMTSRHQDVVAIILLNNNILQRKGKKIQNLNSHQSLVDEYIGHYVILCGTSDNLQHIQAARESTPDEIYKLTPHGGENEFCCVLANPDPSRPIPYMYVMPEHLESAWRSMGTDDDIIFVRKGR
jgi:hypothetical protein